MIMMTLTPSMSLLSLSLYSSSRRKRESSPSSDVEADYDNQRSTVRPSRALQADIERWKKSVQPRDQQLLVTASRKPPKTSGVRRAVSSVIAAPRTKTSMAALDNKVRYLVFNNNLARERF